MSMNPQGLKAKMSERIFQGMKRAFAEVNATPNYSPIVEIQWRKMADAISDIALDIVSEIKSNAEVKPGIPVSGGNSTVGPGKIS